MKIKEKTYGKEYFSHSIEEVFKLIYLYSRKDIVKRLNHEQAHYILATQLGKDPVYKMRIRKKGLLGILNSKTDLVVSVSKKNLIPKEIKMIALAPKLMRVENPSKADLKLVNKYREMSKRN